MGVSRHNISLDPKVYEEFLKYADRYGIKTSTWINQKMVEFVEEQKTLDRLREQKNRI